MEPFDWNAEAIVQERDDGGSDMYYEFKTVARGSVAAMVTHVCALPSEEQARLVMDVKGGGTLNIAQINALAQRADFPGSAV